MLKLKGHYDVALINKDTLSPDILDSILSGKSSTWDLIKEKKIVPDQIIGKDNLVSDQGLFQVNGQGSRSSFSGSMFFDDGALFLSQSTTQERTGTAQAGSLNTITLDAGASGTNSFYNGASITILSGTGSGQTRVISAYVGSTKVATVSVNWVTNPDSTSVFHISPLIDYREQTGIMGFTLDVTGTPVNQIITGTAWQGEYNFPAPVSTRTVRIIGLKASSSTSGGNIWSFITLSTPISQTSSHLLFVRYILQGSYSSLVGIGGVTNSWVQDRVNSAIFTNHNLATQQFCMSRFLNPVDLTKVARQGVYLRASDQGGSPAATVAKDASKFRQSATWSLLSADLPGPHACAYSNVTAVDGGSGTDQSGERPIIAVMTQDQTIQIGTMFKHAAGDSSFFSNPGSPPTSLGSLTVTGTSTVDKIFKKLYALFTSSGDASNIIPETFTRSGNQLVVAQDWTNAALGSIVTCTLSTTGTLPAPLVPATTYYIIYDDATHIRLATSQANALAVIPITLTDAGTGIHTITRTSTGKFKLAVNLYKDLSPIHNHIDCRHIHPTFLGSNIQNSNLDDWTDTPQSGPGAFSESYRRLKVFWGQVVGSFLYFVQEETSTTNQWICKWRFNTLEGSDSLVQLNLQNGSVVVGTDIWIATDNGLVRFNTLTDTVANTYTISDGLLATQVNEICLDPVTGLVWLGHDTGLTKWNPITKVVVSTHTNGVANTFNGLNATQIKVLRGQLTAYNGLICWGGRLEHDYNPDSDRDSPRVYDNNTGFWVRVPNSNFSTSNCSAVALVGDGTAKIILDLDTHNSTSHKVDVWNVSPTGPNAGTFSQFQTTTLAHGNTYMGPSKIHRISKDHFTELPLVDKNVDQFDYVVSTNTITREQTAAFIGQFFAPSLNPKFITSDIFEVNGVKLIWRYGFIFGTKNDQLFGWTGSAWDRDTLTARDIPDSTITNISDGINFNFDNAGGQPSSSQFITGENMMVVTGPGTIKSNLQTMSYKMYDYVAELKKITGRVQVLSGTTYTAPEGAFTDFLSLETDADYITVLNVTLGNSVMTQVPSSPAAGQYSVSQAGVFTFNAAQNGQTVNLTFHYLERH